MEYKLIYVNSLGFGVGGFATYEFVFCDDTIDIDDVWGDGWHEIPAFEMACPPEEDCIADIKTLKVKDYELDVAHNSFMFGLCDAKDGVIALAWEAIDANFSSKSERLVFRFGETLEEIEEKLKKRNLELI